MGLGRVYYSRPRALPALGDGGGPDLQLVELICASGKSQSPIGGDHQPALFTLGRGAPEQSWRCAASYHHSSARRGGQSEIAARWYPWVVGSIQSNCGAVENQVGLATPL